MSLREKIETRSSVIAVIGLGYVGLPLAVLQAKTGFRVWGIEEDKHKVEKVNAAVSYLADVDADELRETVRAGRLSATTDFACLSECDVVLICVLTPLLRTRFIELAGEINDGMPYFVVSKLQRLLNRRGKCLNGASILVMGVTYKADVGDPRESPATKVMELLQKEEAELLYVDPYTPKLSVGEVEYTARRPTSALLAACDACLILTAHSTFDYDMLVEHAPIIFDTRNGTRHVKGKKRPRDLII